MHLPGKGDVPDARWKLQNVRNELATFGRRIVGDAFVNAYLWHACRDVGYLDARRWIAACNVEENGIRMYRPLGCWQFDFIKMGLAIRGSIDAKVLHAADSNALALLSEGCLPQRTHPNTTGLARESGGRKLSC